MIRSTLAVVAVVLGAAWLGGCKLPAPQGDADEEGPVADPGRPGTRGEPPAYGADDPGQGTRRAHRHRGRHRRNRDGDPRRDGPRRRWRETPADPSDPGGMSDPGGQGEPGGWAGPRGRRRGMPEEPPSGGE
jgi:hypothetical protein